MNMRVATSLMTAIAIAISTGSFAGRNVYAAQADDQESLQQSQHKMENKAAEIGKKLDELDQKIKTAKDEAKADMSRQMDELREMQKNVQQKLKEMKTASGKALQDAKEGAISAMDDLQKAYEKARARFGN
jgi:peptidoglycan hydrolase CwlO-like protein